MKDDGKHPNEGIHTYFGQHAGEQRRYSDRRSMVRRRQPKEKREHTGLNAECRHKNKGDGRHQLLGFMAHNFLVQMGHVQSARETIKQAQSQKK